MQKVKTSEDFTVKKELNGNIGKNYDFILFYDQLVKKIILTYMCLLKGLYYIYRTCRNSFLPQLSISGSFYKHSLSSSACSYD